MKASLWTVSFVELKKILAIFTLIISISSPRPMFIKIKIWWAWRTVNIWKDGKPSTPERQHAVVENWLLWRTKGLGVYLTFAICCQWILSKVFHFYKSDFLIRKGWRIIPISKCFVYSIWYSAGDKVGAQLILVGNSGIWIINCIFPLLPLNKNIPWNLHYDYICINALYV